MLIRGTPRKEAHPASPPPQPPRLGAHWGPIGDCLTCGIESESSPLVSRLATHPDMDRGVNRGQPRFINLIRSPIGPLIGRYRAT